MGFAFYGMFYVWFPTPLPEKDLVGMNILAERELDSPIVAISGDTISISVRDEIRGELKLLTHTITEPGVYTHAFIFEVNNEMGVKYGIGGLLGLKNE